MRKLLIVPVLSILEPFIGIFKYYFEQTEKNWAILDDQYGQVSVQAVSVEDTVCYGCGKKGHYRRNCPDSASGGRTNAPGGNKRRPVVC